MLEQRGVRRAVEVGGGDAGDHDGIDVVRGVPGALEQEAGRARREGDRALAPPAEAALAEADETAHPAIAGLEELGLFGGELAGSGGALTGAETHALEPQSGGGPGRGPPLLVW